jgi:ABC-type cobalamin/Fe3+-siderophores transport system ATPase subunit
MIGVPAYEVRDVAFHYAHRAEERHGDRWELHEISFDAAEGEILGIIGPNGSGKTSLLKLMARLLRPQAGTIRLFGSGVAEMTQNAVARTVAVVPQENHSVFSYTILQTVLMGRFPHRRSSGLGLFSWEGQDDLRLAHHAMEELDVTHLASRSIHEVSGGERQRAVIARALTQEPRVLLLDEPTAFLDLNHQVEICRILRRLNEQRRLTVVMVSHDLNMASQYCDRLMLIDNGGVVRLGSPEEVLQPGVLADVYHCEVIVDRHPDTGLPRVTLPGRENLTASNVNG